MSSSPAGADLITRLDEDLKQAMRDRDEVRKLTLRSAKTALTEAAKASEQHDLSPEKVLAVLQREAKRRKEAAFEYEKAGETARAQAELAELAVLETYLPQPLSDDDVRALVLATVAETGATSPKEMGKVMAALKPKIDGRADGKLVSTLVREALGG
ncbi:MAG: GatB/YqeY domain-containing protein [Caldilineaceae bacterium]